MRQLSKRLMSWASIVDDNTIDQAELASRLPFIHPHIALMPDAHLGKGATVGSVIPTDRAIIPAAVGVDIGCGMSAIKTQFTYEDVLSRGLRHLINLREAIEAAVPLGRHVNSKVSKTAEMYVNNLETRAAASRFDPGATAQNWQLQLGSLGSGNHFIEIVLDELDTVWAFLHSGSRGIGNRIAQRHIKIAQKLMDRYFIELPDPDLAYLVEDSDEFWEYMRQLVWAQEFAQYNRMEMMNRVLAALGNWLDEPVERRDGVDCHHNYTQKERHFGKNVWVSRKGAIDASEGTLGLIPGSMGSASYVVKGLGNRLSLNSAPHGAGRAFSRSLARRTFTHEELRASMKGVEWRDSEAFLDEIPAAYKDIDMVMEDASDLVVKVNTFRQIVNVKGE